MSNRRNVDSDKVNSVLKDFELSLKKHQPNLQELALITQKINELYQRNVRKKMMKQRKSSTIARSTSPHSQEQKWRKIKIE